ncbi:hypothetical protein D3C80_1820220 [compost metagenome]
MNDTNPRGEFILTNVQYGLVQCGQIVTLGEEDYTLRVDLLSVSDQLLHEPHA